jgi:hypothetical protein
MGPIISKRIVADSLTIPDITSVKYDNPLTVNLLVAQENTDDEVESDGSSVAEVNIHSKVVGFKWQGYIQGPSGEAVNVRYILYKNIDGEGLISNCTDSFFHNSNDTPTAREVRSLIISKGIMHLSESQGVTKFNLFVRRKTLHRLGNMKEGDKLTLLIAADVAMVTNAKLYGFGTLYVRTQ